MSRASALPVSAKARFDATTFTGFISRGDVIRYAGEDALTPFVGIAVTWTETWHVSSNGVSTVPVTEFVNFSVRARFNRLLPESARRTES